MTTDDVSALRERLRHLEEERDAARVQAEQWRQVAEERRVVLERVRQHPAVRVLFALRDRLAPLLRVVRRAQSASAAATGRARRVMGAARALARQRGAGDRRRRLERLRLRLDARPPTLVDTTVSVVVITRDGGPALVQLLESLDEALDRLDGEVIIVDNGGGVARRLENWSAPRRRVLVLDQPASFSAANNRGLQAAVGEFVCFLNDDVLPVNRDWLGDMLEALETPGVAVAGAQLLYAPQPAMRRRFADLSVQHIGINLQWRGEQVPRPANVGCPAPVDDDRPGAVAAVTAACLVARREDLVAVAGFDEGYDFGAEDVDLCLRLRALHGDVVVVPTALLLHHEGATRRRDPDEEQRARQQRNWRRFESVHGPLLWHEVARDRILGHLRLADRPLRVAITVTRDDATLLYGDLVTARRLGEQLEGLGYVVEYIERYRDAWYDLAPDVDVVVALLDTFDVRRVARPGLTVVAWIRNWEARWIAHPWANLYDVVLTSGERGDVAAAFDQWGIPVGEMPLAPSSVPDERPSAAGRAGVVTTVNNWGDDRGIPELAAAVPSLELYGAGWDGVPAVEHCWRGSLAPERVAELYRRAEVVVDVAAPHTETGGSVNARVFDALANGAVVVSNQPGVQRLFGGDVPVFSHPAELAAILDAHARDAAPLRSAAERARAVVLDQHTWPRRAEQLRDQLADLADRPRVALLTGAPDGKEGRTWGDTHLAEALGGALARRGMRTFVVPRPRWDDSTTRSADVTVHLKGRGRAPVAPGQINVLWVISHPEEVADDELEGVDLVLAASTRLAEHFRLRTATPVRVMRQATDTRRFRPGPRSDAHRASVVFVGNSRYVERPLVGEAVRAGLDLVVHGGNWERFLPKAVLGRTWIPNEDVPDVYRSADVVLNDHWEVMRTWGLISNRVFDALACEACVVSDDVDELDELFGEGVVTVSSVEQVGDVVRQLLKDPERRRRVASEGRRRVVESHTFDHRAGELAALLDELTAGRVGGGRP